MIDYVKGLYHEKPLVRVLSALALIGGLFFAGYRVGWEGGYSEPSFDIPEEWLSAFSDSTVPDPVGMESVFGPGLWERAIALEVRLVDEGSPVDILVVAWCSDRHVSVASNIVHRDREASLWSNDAFSVPEDFFQEQCRAASGNNGGQP